MPPQPPAKMIGAKRTGAPQAAPPLLSGPVLVGGCVGVARFGTSATFVVEKQQQPLRTVTLRSAGWRCESTTARWAIDRASRKMQIDSARHARIELRGVASLRFHVELEDGLGVEMRAVQGRVPFLTWVGSSERDAVAGRGRRPHRRMRSARAQQKRKRAMQSS